MKKFLLVLTMMLVAMIPTTGVFAANPVPMTATTAAQIVLIDVGTASLHFVSATNGGPVVVGTDSAALSFNITNTGNVPITISVAVGGADATFFNNCLFLSSGGAYSSVVGWTYTTAIPVDGSVTIYAKIHPLSVITGAAATLTFIGTSTVPLT